MNSGYPELLLNSLADQIGLLMQNKLPGHCLRIDHVNPDVATEILVEMRSNKRDFEIFILASQDDSKLGPDSISEQRAIKKRNLKESSLVLLVPNNQVADSLDNAFNRISIADLIQNSIHEFHEKLDFDQVGILINQIRRLKIHNIDQEDLAIFLGFICENPTVDAIGKELWRIGLVPDLDNDHLIDFLNVNALCVRALSQPKKPTSGFTDRLSAAGVRDGSFKDFLQFFMESKASEIALPKIWCKEIFEKYSGRLTFENWPMVDTVDVDLVDLRIDSFREQDGKVKKSSLLSQSSEGNLFCYVAEEKPAKVKVTWKTDPGRVISIASWQVDLVPPSDLRDDSFEPTVSMKVNGSRRTATLTIDLNEADLSNLNRFVIRVRALTIDGDAIEFVGGGRADAESDEFDVLWTEEESRTLSRKGNAASICDAVLHSVASGIDKPSEEVNLNLSEGLINLKISDKRLYRIPISRTIAKLQDFQLEHPNNLYSFEVQSSNYGEFDFDAIKAVELSFTGSFLDKRAGLFKLLANRTPRHYIETASFDDEISAGIRSLAAAYRRAIDNSDGEVLKSLLRVDTLNIFADSEFSEVQSVVLLPHHPMRMLWALEHDLLIREWSDDLSESESISERASRLDPAAVSRISPANFPFCVLSASGEVAHYFEELTHGSALYVVGANVESEVVSEFAHRGLGIVRDSMEQTTNSQQVGKRILTYLRSMGADSSVKFLNHNPGEGKLLADSLARVFQNSQSEDLEESTINGSKWEVVAYSKESKFADPVHYLHDLLIEQTSRPCANANHLMPPMRLSVRNLDKSITDLDGANLSLVQNISSVEVCFTNDLVNRSPYLNGLMTSVYSVSQESNEEISWVTKPTLKGNNDLTATHASYLSGIAKNADLEMSAIGIKTSLDSSGIGELRALHERSDWVITSDRFLGMDLYGYADSSLLGRSYLLDYTPDFIEGFSNRLTVTTSHRSELRKVLEVGMKELGLYALGSQSLALDMLNIVSGRLALRLALSADNHAREAVSLAALVSHLKSRGKLDGHIIIPIDAHPEIFGQALRLEDEGGRRCDLLLVKVTSKSFRIECIEVKSRQHAALPDELAERIVQQLLDTEALLKSRFFANDPVRVDAQLQRSILCSLLHYYADRAHSNGIIQSDEIELLHKNIEKVEDPEFVPEIVLSGFVIALQDSGHFKERYRNVPITVLTATELEAAGFTTMVEAATRTNFIESNTLTQNAISNFESDEEDPGIGDSGVQVVPPKTPNSGSAIVSMSEELVGSSVIEEERIVNMMDEKPVESLQHSIPAVSVSHILPESVEVLLGTDQSQRPVIWNVSTKGSPHAFLIGIPGQGKSVSTRNILSSFAKAGLPSLVFDFHGDMAANPPDGATVLDVRGGLPFSPFELKGFRKADVNATALEVAEIVGYVCGMGDIQRMSIYKGLCGAYEARGWDNGKEGNGLPTIEEFADAVEAVEAGAKGKNARDRIRPLTDFGLFADDISGTFDPRGGGGGVIVDVSQLPLESVQLAASAFILRKVYREMFLWDQNATLKLAIVLDEAHRLAKDRTLPKLMKEGRKYGVSVLVASQGVDDFHRDVLGNAGLKIVFRTNFPASKTVAGYLRGRAGQDLSKQIELLNVGEAYVSTPDSSQAQKVQMFNGDKE
jgi:DNA phosphorothioation-dependent restriction protein DptH